MEGKNRAPNSMKTLNFRSIWSKFSNHLEETGVAKLQREVVEFKNLRGTNKKIWMTPLKWTRRKTLPNKRCKWVRNLHNNLRLSLKIKIDRNVNQKGTIENFSNKERRRVKPQLRTLKIWLTLGRRNNLNKWSRTSLTAWSCVASEVANLKMGPSSVQLLPTSKTSRRDLQRHKRRFNTIKKRGKTNATKPKLSTTTRISWVNLATWLSSAPFLSRNWRQAPKSALFARTKYIKEALFGTVNSAASLSILAVLNSGLRSSTSH